MKLLVRIKVNSLKRILKKSNKVSGFFFFFIANNSWPIDERQVKIDRIFSNNESRDNKSTHLVGNIASNLSWAKKRGDKVRFRINVREIWTQTNAWNDVQNTKFFLTQNQKIKIRAFVDGHHLARARFYEAHTHTHTQIRRHVIIQKNFLFPF